MVGKLEGGGGGGHIIFHNINGGQAAMTQASTTQSVTSLKLVFSPTKRQFKWNGDLTSLKDFWVTNLEGGNINSLLNVSSNGFTKVLNLNQ